MGKLEAIDKLVDGHKVRQRGWRPKTKHIFMEEDGMIYIARYINDPDAKEINLNKQPEDKWEILDESD